MSWSQWVNISSVGPSFVTNSTFPPYISASMRFRPSLTQARFESFLKERFHFPKLNVVQKSQNPLIYVSGGHGETVTILHFPSPCMKSDKRSKRIFLLDFHQVIERCILHLSINHFFKFVKNITQLCIEVRRLMNNCSY